MELEEAIRTQRAIRRLKPDDVEDALILKLIDLAIRAPTGGNAQSWEFIVVRDPKVRAAIGRLNRLGWSTLARTAYRLGARDERRRKIMAAVDWQAEHWNEIPVLVIPCLHGVSWPVPWVFRASRYGSIFPAVQNLLLAARAEGLGATLTTLPLWNQLGARRILRLPLTVEPVAVIPIGWPRGRYGPTTRRPVEEIVHVDRYGNRAHLAQR